MATKSKANRKSERELGKIQNAGFTALAIGIVLLASPLFLKSSKMLAPVTANVGKIAWPLIAIGVVFLAVHALRKSYVAKTNAVEAEKPLAAKPAAAQRVTSKSNTPAKLLVIEPTLDNQTPSNTWNKQVFADIEWRRFEAVCERLFAQGGFTTKSQSHSADGGVDIWMYSAHAEGPVSIAQCKHFKSKEVDVKLIREFYGVMTSHKLQRGTFVTTSTYTADAQKFANDNSINILDGDKLLKLIATRTPEQQKELLDIAYEGEYSIPTCASCGIKLVKRAKFWGCSNYPRCRTQIYFKAA